MKILNQKKKLTEAEIVLKEDRFQIPILRPLKGTWGIRLKEKKAKGNPESREDKKSKLNKKDGREKRNQTVRRISLLMEGSSLILGILGVYGMGLLLKMPWEDQLRNMVMTALGISLVGYLYRQEGMGGRLDYNNRDYPVRFWTSFLIALPVALSCVFLPQGGWPITVVFITLSLFSNGVTGVLAGAVLLMITSFLSGAHIGVFMLYFLSGSVGVAFFRRLDVLFQVWMPIAMSMMVLMVCETANIVLFANDHLRGEMFVIPIANVIISSVLLTGILKLFSSVAVYRHRVRYMELNDMEGELLTRYKEEARQEFYQSMHTAYFCDRIAKRLELDAEAVKTAGLFHKYSAILDQDRGFAPMAQLMKQKGFPPATFHILREYIDNDAHVTCKETAVLMFADAVTASVMYVFSKDKTAVPDYDRIIDMIFRKRMESGVLNECGITMKELTIMRKIFKEEKLYYDFLR